MLFNIIFVLLNNSFHAHKSLIYLKSWDFTKLEDSKVLVTGAMIDMLRPKCDKSMSSSSVYQPQVLIVTLIAYSFSTPHIEIPPTPWSMNNWASVQCNKSNTWHQLRAWPWYWHLTPRPMSSRVSNMTLWTTCWDPGSIGQNVVLSKLLSNI